MLLAMLLVGGALRVGYVLYHPQLPVVGDALAYDQEARGLALGKGVFPRDDGSGQLAKGPAYPFLIAALYTALRPDPFVVRVAQAVLGVAAIALVVLLARQTFGSDVAVLAGWMAAVYPPFVSYAGLLLTESVGVLLLLVFVGLAVRARGRSGVGGWSVAGVAGGILILTREEMIVVVVATALAVGWWQRRLAPSAVLLLAAALVIAPWTLRNYVAYGQLVLVSPQAGSTLWISSFPRDSSVVDDWDEDDPYYRSLVAGLSGLGAERRLWQEGLRNIRERPGAYLRACLDRIPRFWIGGHSNTIAGFEGALGSYVGRRDWGRVAFKLLLLGYNLAIVGLGILGLWWAWRTGPVDRASAGLLAIPVLAKAIVHFFLFAALRYQVIIMGPLIIFAAFGLLRHRTARAVPASA